MFQATSLPNLLSIQFSPCCFFWGGNADEVSRRKRRKARKRKKTQKGSLSQKLRISDARLALTFKPFVLATLYECLDAGETIPLLASVVALGFGLGSLVLVLERSNGKLSERLPPRSLAHFRRPARSKAVEGMEEERLDAAGCGLRSEPRCGRPRIALVVRLVPDVVLHAVERCLLEPEQALLNSWCRAGRARHGSRVAEST